jgi:hypothetical protein
MGKLPHKLGKILIVAMLPFVTVWWAHSLATSVLRYAEVVATTGYWFEPRAVKDLFFALFLGSTIFSPASSLWVPILFSRAPSTVRRFAGMLFPLMGAVFAASAFALALALLLAGGSSELALDLAASIFWMWISAVKLKRASRARTLPGAAIIWPAAARQEAAPITQQLTVEEMYERLLRAYLSAWGGPPERARAKLEADIGKLVGRGLSREEAVKRLYR